MTKSTANEWSNPINAPVHRQAGELLWLNTFNLKSGFDKFNLFNFIKFNLTSLLIKHLKFKTKKRARLTSKVLRLNPFRFNILRLWVTAGSVLLFLGQAGGLSVDAAVLQGGVTHMENVAAPGVVGIDMQIQPGANPIILVVFPGSPAARAGLQNGDVVLSVDGVALKGLSRQAVDLAIPDVPGTTVVFRVQRSGRTATVPLTVQAANQLSPTLQRVYTGIQD